MQASSGAMRLATPLREYGFQMRFPEAAILTTPSAFFEWCLKTSPDEIPFRSNYPQYYALMNSADYLWRTYDRRLSDITTLVRPGLRVLEIGCGIGADLHWLALKGANVTGIDVKSEWTDAARKLTDHVRRSFDQDDLSVDIRRVNLLDLPRDQYDLIYMKDTFHHLEPRDKIVAKIATLLAPGGKVVIVEPNAWNPAIQYKMFRIRGFNTIIEKIDKATGEHFVYGNERLVSGGSIAHSFEAHGVKGSSRLFRLIPTALASRPALVGVANLLETLRIEPLLVPLCIHSVYCGTKT